MRLRFFSVLLCATLLSHCSQLKKLGSRLVNTEAATVNLVATGLAGGNFTVKINDETPIQVTSAGKTQLSSNLRKGDQYTLTVVQQPIFPNQVCAGTLSGVVDNVDFDILLNCESANFKIGGNVNGLAGSGLQLRLNGGEVLPVAANGSFQFFADVADGSSYNVQVAQQPTSPNQICTPSANSAIVLGGNVSTVQIICNTVPYFVGGFVTGMTGSGLVLQLNGGDDLTVNANGFVTFGTAVADGSPFQVTVKTAPSGTTQQCGVTNGSGVVNGQAIFDFSVNCATQAFSLGGSVTGLTGTGLALFSSSGEVFVINNNGNFTLNQSVGDGSDYLIDVFRQPTGPTQTCTVNNNTGTLAGANVTNLNINCSTNAFSVGGTVSGLSTTGLVLRLNNTHDLIIPQGNSAFTFASNVVDGQNYAVSIAAQPAGLFCTVGTNTGTISSANITNVDVDCNPAFTVGGTVTGASGSNLVLRNNGVDLVIVANGSYTFPDSLATGAAYNVLVANHPENPYQSCTVANGGGVVGAANISNVNINCTTITLEFTTTSVTRAESFTSFNLPITINPALTRDTVVNYTFVFGNATPNVDFSPPNGVLNLNSGANSAQIAMTIVNDSIQEPTESFQINLSSATGAVIGSNNTYTYTITDDDISNGAAITNIDYFDADRNGKIDHARITFDGNVQDNTLENYVNTSTNVDVSDGEFDVAGYGGELYVPQVCIDRSVPADGDCLDGGTDITDVVDNSIVWIKFTEGSTYDTNATPDFTITDASLKTLAIAPSDCYILTIGANCQTRSSADLLTITITEADKADPILVAAWSDPIIDAWQLRLQWSEPVDTLANASCTASDVQMSDFTYNNVSAAGVTNIRSDFADNNGCDVSAGGYYVIPRVDNRYIYGDFQSDTITLNATFYDTADNASIAQTVAVTYDPALEVYYPVDAAAPVNDDSSTVQDVSGNNRDGTVSGALLSPDMGERANQAYKFDGVDDSITITGYPGIQGTDARTMSAWVKIGTASSEYFPIISQNGGPGCGSWRFRGRKGDGRWSVGSGSCSVATNTFVNKHEGGWHHVAVVYDSTFGTDITDSKLYVNGIEQAIAGASVAGTLLTSTTADVKIGTRGVNYAKGKIDEARIYSRALSAEEIKKLATKVPGGLVAHYQLDDNSGASGSITDLSGQNTATNSSGTWTNDRYNQSNLAMNFTGGQQFNGTGIGLPQGSSDRTFCTWAYSNGYPGHTTAAVIAGFGVSGGSNQSNTISFWGFSGDTGILFLSDSSTYLRYDVNLTHQVWHHFCFSITGGNQVMAYMNGSKILPDASNGSMNLNTGSGTIRVGQGLSGTSDLNGRVDGVRIYNRILSDGEVKALATELDRGLVAYYPLDDNTISTAADAIKDYSGSGYDLTLTTGPSPTTDRDGNDFSAYQFTGTGYILRNDTMTQLPQNNEPRTTCAWTQAGTLGRQRIVQFGRNGSSDNHTVYFLQTNATTGFLKSSFSSGDAESPVIASYSDWFHVCGRFDGATNELIVNGVLEASTSYSSGATPQENITLGARPTGGDRWDGKMDDARIYNRALSLAEIRELSGFHPGQLDDNTLWLDATRGTYNDAGTTLATNGQTVQEWHDISFDGSGNANGLNVTKSTSSQRPIWRNDIGITLNTMPVVRFDGTDDHLSRSVLGTDLLAATEYSIFAVMLQDGTQAENGLIQWGNNGNDRVSLIPTENDTIRFMGSRLHDPTGMTDIAQPANWDNNYHTLYAYLDGSSGEINVDGTTLDSFTNMSYDLTNTSSTADLNIGRENGPQYLMGDIAEILFYKRAVTVEERKKILCYFDRKYKQPAATFLPAGFCD